MNTPESRIAELENEVQRLQKQITDAQNQAPECWVWRLSDSDEWKLSDSAYPPICRGGVVVPLYMQPIPSIISDYERMRVELDELKSRSNTGELK